MVIVRATDPSGVARRYHDHHHRENANEAPSVTGRAVLTVMEAPDDYVRHSRTSTGRAILESANEYLASQPEEVDSIATWHLEGPDAGAFDLGGHVRAALPELQSLRRTTRIRPTRTGTTCTR